MVLRVGLTLTVLLGACASLPPHQEGMARLAVGEEEAALVAFEGPARNGNAVSAREGAKLILSEAARGDAEEAVRWLEAAARSGDDQALALLIVASAPFGELQNYALMLTLMSATVEGLDGGWMPAPGAELLGQTLPIALVETAERQLGEPVASGFAIYMLAALGEVLSWPDTGAVVRRSLMDWASIDQDRAAAGDRYAMGRHADRIVGTDPMAARQLYEEAAKAVPAPQTCIYQPPVTIGGAGSTRCRPSGEPAPGLDAAKARLARMDNT